MEPPACIHRKADVLPCLTSTMSEEGLRPFEGTEGPRFTQALYRFPGSFHLPVLTSILERHPEARVIGDPMVGSGSTALIGVALGRSVIAADLDPLACLLTRAKTCPVDPGNLIELVESLLDSAGPMGYRARARLTPQETIERMELRTRFRSPQNVFHWFHPTVARDLAQLLLEFAEWEHSLSEDERDAVLAIIASSIRRVSRADPKPVSGLEVTGPRKEALQGGLRFDLHHEVLGRTKVLAEGYSELLNQPKLGVATVKQEDVRDWKETCDRESRRPSIQITSPPYLRAIDYVRRHKLEYSWLGLVPARGLRTYGRQFFGAGVVRDRARALTRDGLPGSVIRAYAAARLEASELDALVLKQYFLDLQEWLVQSAQVATAAEGDLYVVVGAGHLRGMAVDTPRLLTDMARKIGLRLLWSSKYRLVNQRMQYLLKSQPRVRTEHILHFRPVDS